MGFQEDIDEYRRINKVRLNDDDNYICLDCGAIIYSPERHHEWHEKFSFEVLLKRIKRLEQVVIDHEHGVNQGVAYSNRTALERKLS